MSDTTWRVGPATSAAQLAATIVFADTGPANSRVRLYSTTRPAVPGDHTDTPMATVALDKPVTDEANGGDFTVAGGVTPPGETSPLLQAGGLVLLGATALT